MAYPPGMTTEDLIHVGELFDPNEPPDCDHDFICADCEIREGRHDACDQKGKRLLCLRCEYIFEGMFYDAPELDITLE